MVIHRLWRSVVEWCDHFHVLQAVPGRWRIFVGCQRELDFQATDAAAIPDVHLAKLTGRWRCGHRSVEAFEEANTAFPQDESNPHSYDHPDDGGQCGHEPQAIREAVQAARGSLASIHRNAFAGGMRCSRISSSIALILESSFEGVTPKRNGLAAATAMHVLQARGSCALKCRPASGWASRPHNVSRRRPSGRTDVLMACDFPNRSNEPLMLRS